MCYTQDAYITERQNDCVTIYRKRREYYRAIQARTNALQFTGSDASITERYKPERMRYDLLKTTRILQNNTRQSECVTIHRKNGVYYRNREMTKSARCYDKRCRLQKR